MQLEKAKELLKKIWHFLVHEDSWASFLADAVIILLFGKFILLPLLGLIFGTAYPAVAVLTTSMDHKHQNFESWWFNNGGWYENAGITKERFGKFYKHNGVPVGDAFIVRGVKSLQELKVGDIIVFQMPGRSTPIIHRVIKVDKDFVSTKGDANSAQFEGEKEISLNRVHGKAILWCPWIGWPKVLVMKAIGLVKL
jgi:signal peptidase I